ncbi:hypothetical protein ST47_g3642 [Ascochyta rabiei]|uniref:Uncharacterized protein n=1 Tax=Didymella rabiei TaxID=5454 RepID=A0A163HBG2_DIDRA|nr:hypothetical protein ST47_g3642 [Ascochyta rabiei]
MAIFKLLVSSAEPRDFERRTAMSEQDPRNPSHYEVRAGHPRPTEEWFYHGFELAEGEDDARMPTRTTYTKTSFRQHPKPVVQVPDDDLAIPVSEIPKKNVPQSPQPRTARYRAIVHVRVTHRPLYHSSRKGSNHPSPNMGNTHLHATKTVRFGTLVACTTLLTALMSSSHEH